jgi:hypothetical protein
LSSIDVSERNIAATFEVKKTQKSDNFTLKMEAIWWPRNWLGDQGLVEFSAENKIFFVFLRVLHPSRPAPGPTHSSCTMGTVGCFSYK